MAKKTTVRKPHLAEVASGHRDEISLSGRMCDRTISEKMGADGIIETHVNHSYAKKAYWGRPKDRMCGACQKWVIKTYKIKAHGYPCVRTKESRKK